MNDAKKPNSDREYDKSGFYTEGKSFRVWALLAWLTGAMVVLMAVSVLLNTILL
ncbi:hypothetical protein JYU22_01855 [Gammaproteobacteria bacterium AH-315-E17]|nr:hypothetical protein [Gammaproteobacteria bacterium AH-315-E17]